MDRAIITPDLEFLFGKHFETSEDLYHQSRDNEWAGKQLDAFTENTIASWNLKILLHIVAFNREMGSRSIPMLRKYVKYYSEE